MRKKSWGEYRKSIPDMIIEKLRTSKVSENIKGGSELLDLGCGYKAPFLNSLSEKIQRGVGIDISVSNDNQPKNIILIKGRVDENIKLKSNQFDVVTALALIEHVENPEKMLQESYRLLKRGGNIFITTPSVLGKPLLEFLAFRLHIISSSEVSDHKRYYNRESLQEILETCGFKNIEVKYFAVLNIFAKATK